MKEKVKVEDGIFGTSGGIGFTKQNELFVGRVAMIGFAVSLLTITSSFVGSPSITRLWPCQLENIELHGINYIFTSAYENF